MNYALCVLSHGDSHRMMKAAVHLFGRYVQPEPTQVIHHHDDASEGFCKATSRLWEKASESTAELVFWLEHDFRFTRQVTLNPIASVLRANPMLAQVAFIREPVNETETKAGGVYQMHPPSAYIERRYRSKPWLEHRINFTTNPSLLRRQVMVDNPWPDYSSECEGKFSADLLTRGYRFAYWGTGEPWCRHIGPMRTGTGY